MKTLFQHAATDGDKKGRTFMITWNWLKTPRTSRNCIRASSWLRGSRRRQRQDRSQRPRPSNQRSEREASLERCKSDRLPPESAHTLSRAGSFGAGPFFIAVRPQSRDWVRAGPCVWYQILVPNLMPQPFTSHEAVIYSLGSYFKVATLGRDFSSEGPGLFSPT
jgi:hypothetical protein